MFRFWAANSTTSLDWVILGHQPAYFVGFGDLTAQLRRCPTNLLGPAITSFFLFNGALNRPKHIFGVQQKMNRLPRICLESSMAHGLIWPSQNNFCYDILNRPKRFFEAQPQTNCLPRICLESSRWPTETQWGQNKYLASPQIQSLDSRSIFSTKIFVLGQFFFIGM